MKYFKWFFCCALAVLLLTLPALAALPAEVEDALPRDAAKLLEDVPDWDGGSLAAGLCSIVSRLKGDAAALIRRQTRGAASVFLVVILCGLIQGLSEGAEETGRLLTMAGTLAVTALSVGDLNTLMGAGRTVIGRINTFSQALLPALAAISALSGGVTSAAARQVATVFFSDLLLEVIDGGLMPMVYLYTGALAAGSCLGDKRLLAVAELMKAICSRALAVSLLLFTLYLTVSGVFAGTVDSASIRVTKAAISGAVPVVGGILAEASEAVLAGSGLLKGTVGVFGLLGVLAICAYPFLEIGLQYLLYRLMAFLSVMVGGESLRGLIRGLGGAFGLILGMVGSSALILLISILASVAAVSL